MPSIWFQSLPSQRLSPISRQTAVIVARVYTLPTPIGQRSQTQNPPKSTHRNHACACQWIQRPDRPRNSTQKHREESQQEAHQNDQGEVYRSEGGGKGQEYKSAGSSSRNINYTED
jgi:hypothetical protein